MIVLVIGIYSYLKLTNQPRNARPFLYRKNILFIRTKLALRNSNKWERVFGHITIDNYIIINGQTW